ncbi:MAG: TIGR02281 family clan AA aspartic protease [Defluviicoccus sp.]
MIFWAVKQLVVWSIVCVLAVVIWTDEGAIEALFRRVVATAGSVDAAVEESTGDDGARVLTLRAGAGGHFWVDAEVNGNTVRFIVDTGATSVVLSEEDADRAGLRLSPRDYTALHRTAGGTVRAAPVTLREVHIGALGLRDVEAAVNPALSGVSLLGMTFLNRLDGYEVRGDTLSLYW